MSAPRALERLAAACLGANATDSRLGDLSEQYVRTSDQVRTYLGDTPLAASVSYLAADARYLLSTANVMLFARVVDPLTVLGEPGAKQIIALDLKERTMALAHATTRNLVLPALLLVGSAFLINGAANVWTTWRETEALMVSLQREKAEAAALQISQFLASLQEQIGWTATAAPLEHRRIEYLRLLRQVPAITEITLLSPEGKETLMVSRLRMDVVGRGADLSGDARFTEALRKKTYVGSVYFNKRAEPYLSIAVSHPGGVTVAEVNVRRLWDVIEKIKVGESGYAYVIDGKGRLIASRDRDQVLRQADLSSLPQVAGTSSAGPTFDASPSGVPVMSVHAAIPTSEWKVFVELPVAEARAPLWSALGRAAGLLGLGVLAIFLASVAATRRAAHRQPVRN